MRYDEESRLTSWRWISAPPAFCFFSSSSNCTFQKSHLSIICKFETVSTCDLKQWFWNYVSETSISRTDDPPIVSFSMMRLRVAATRFSLLILSLEDIPVVMRSMSMVPIHIPDSFINDSKVQLTEEQPVFHARQDPDLCDVGKGKQNEYIRTGNTKKYITCGMVCCRLLHCLFKKPKSLDHVWLLNLQVPVHNPVKSSNSSSSNEGF